MIPALAVVTGAGSGIGRALVGLLLDRGLSVAAVDLDDAALETLQSEFTAAPRCLMTTHLCDVTDRVAVRELAASVASAHSTDHLAYLFNNAGVAAGHSFVADAEPEWERTFSVCWHGVYNCTREFLPMLQRSAVAHLVNVSSVNGFWAWLGPGQPHTAYSAAKFAVKGFTESLIEDFRLHAPNVRAYLVMPGLVRTNISVNSARVAGRETGLAEVAPNEGLSSLQAAQRILDGVDRGDWRILVGDDAEALDFLVRTSPDTAYDPSPVSAGRQFARIGGSFFRSLPALARARRS